MAQTTFRTDPGDDRAFREAGAEIRRLMRQAQAAGADAVQFPEAALCFPDKRSLSRDPDLVTEADWTRFAWGSSQQEIDLIRTAAGSLRLWTVLGAQQPHPSDPSDPSGRPTTSLLVINPSGPSSPGTTSVSCPAASRPTCTRPARRASSPTCWECGSL